MWEYSDKVKELYKNPKNVGSIENADAIGEAGSLSCGDALKIYLKIDENNVITDAKFQTFGCGSAVAASSILTEMVVGKTVEEAKKITNKQIVEELGGLPAEKIHCSVMGYEALEDALKDYDTGNGDAKKEIKKDPSNKIICHCFDVSEKDIVKAIKEKGITTLEGITEATYAGGACGRCKEQLQNILDEVNGEKICEKTPPQSIMSEAQFVLAVNKVIEKVIASELSKDSGGIELIDVKDKDVYVKLTGACEHCPRSHDTLKNFVQAQLRECVDEAINVIEA